MRRGLLVLVVGVVTLWVTAPARGAYQEPGLNAAASAVAGHAVIASCAATDAEWAQFETVPGFPFEVDGFTYASKDNVIYLSPRVCQTLTALEDPLKRNEVGPYWAALAIKSLVHESVHQRGVLDEGVTDCTAVTLVSEVAVRSFGYPATSKVYVYTKTKAGTYRRTSKTVPNPVLARLTFWASQWHRAMPAIYQGGC